ncbi:MAG: hypothetical protein AVDCRST_MAG15-293 [uncultured Rubellimicrobium sp.]|uniref:Uncharacterized protein n=1 Tax=uncultured Rubellimicrobium sp. TaxID=543078 RepID=A0A6J4NHE2_9RHOB|nr:MAG: hypothetical protein AVDCRST_MAG15-293 [uncultured Rubellimicrobium sp.]
MPWAASARSVRRVRPSIMPGAAMTRSVLEIWTWSSMAVLGDYGG